jgi:type I restriction enzyme, S subunit
MLSKPWPQITVRALTEKGQAEIKTGPFGTQLHASDYVEKGTPVINARNIGFGSIREDKLEYISDETVKRLSSHLLRPSDIVFGRKGTVERHVYIRPEQNNWFQGTDCLRLRLKSPDVEPRYVSYYLTTEYHKQWIINQSSHGATMTSLNQDIISRISFPLPPLLVQRKIAEVLSAYDDLIEVNTRRIRILEQMAQAVYHERFGKVDEKELPEGWEVKTFSDVCNQIIDGDWIETKDQGGEGYRLLQVSNIGLGDFVETGNLRYITQETFDRLNCQEVVPGDILVSRMPTPIGRGWLVTEMPWRMITSVDVAIVRPNPELLNLFYCVYWLNSPDTLARSEMNSSGTTRPRITRRVLSGFNLVIPPIELQNKFGDIASNVYRMQTLLRRKNANLRRTRDLLLPRLVSGEVEGTVLE